jgi:DNA-binding transcriptional regulator YiaG
MVKRCVTCKKTGTVHEVRAEFVYSFSLADGTRLKFVFEEFPQEVCSSCDERYIGPAALEAERAVTRELIARQVRDPAVFKRLRKAAGLKAMELGELLGVTAETISHWENGHSQPSRAVWTILDALVEDEIAGRTTTLDRLRAPTEPRIPKRPVHLTLKTALG